MLPRWADEFLGYAEWGDPMQNQECLMRLLGLTDDFMRAHGLEYWIDFGVLLGAVRHRRLIPWDHDLDIGMRPESFRALVTECEQRGSGGELTFEWACPHVYRFSLAGTWVDIFEYEERAGLLCPALSIADREGDPCYADHPVGDILPLRERPVGGRRLPAPGQPEACLQRYYGDYQRYPKIPLFFLFLYHPWAARRVLRGDAPGAAPRGASPRDRTAD